MNRNVDVLARGAKLRMTITMLGLALLAGVARPQTGATQPSSLTLERSVEYALAHYPAVRVALERQAAASAEVGVAKTNYLPRADLLWQGNRATHNNFFGLLLPQNVVPSISGPVLPASSNDNAWDSSAGVLVSWQPLDFGYRASLVNVARAQHSAAKAGTALTRLDVGAAVASAFFNLVSAQHVAEAAQADLQRRQILAKSVHVLVDNQLRPGVDGSRADAELAAARIRSIQAETAEHVARIAFADLLGIAPDGVSIDAGLLLEVPPDRSLPNLPIASHPSALIQNAQTEVAYARVRTLDRSYYPRFYLQSSVSGRGTGVNTDGSLQGGASGLDLQRENWATGLTVTFPLMEIFSIRAHKQVASAQLNAEKARYEQTVQDLSSQMEQARAGADGARRVAENTPAELQAARDNEKQARARYEAGLAPIVEVADAQGLLVQAETSDAIARINAWSSLASVAVAQGDLATFFDLLRPAGGH
jgi:outer membrane protein